MSTRLEMVNNALRETGLGTGLTTLSGLDQESDEAQVARFAIKARTDVSRKLPNISLKKQGTLHTVAQVLLKDQFSDMDGDGESDNALIVTNGSSEVSGVSDNPLQVSSSWAGRLFRVQGVAEVYRIHSVDVADGSFKLADFAGDETEWKGDSQSKDSDGNVIDRTSVWASTNTYPIGEIGQDRYMLPADFKLPDGMQDFLHPSTMVYRSPADFDVLKYDRLAVAFEFGDPQYFTIRQLKIDQGITRWLVEVWPIPKKTLMFPFQYEAGAAQDWPENDQSGFPPEYEEAIASRMRWYVYRFLKKSEFDVQVEEATWREIFTDQQKNPISLTQQFQLVPQMDRDHFGTAYDA